MEENMRIVHLSDFHVNKNHLADINDFVIKALVEDLSNFNCTNKIDLIVISGDLIDKGGQSFKEDIDLALNCFSKNIIRSISHAIDLPYTNFFFCPGNHDIDRKADAEYVDKGLYETLTCVDAVNKFIEDEDNNGIKKILPFKKFEKSFYEGSSIKRYISNFESCFLLEIDQVKIGISCFNSCWRCHESRNDKNNILIGEKQIIRARQITKDSDIKIAVIHHPLDWLSRFDQKAVKNFIIKDYDLIFFGHTHEAETSMNSNFLGSVFVSVAPSNWTYNLRSTDANFSNGYSIVDYDFSKKKITVHNRKYRR